MDEGKHRYCNCCGAETEVHVTRGNNGRIEYCPGCSFPYDYANDD